MTDSLWLNLGNDSWVHITQSSGLAILLNEESNDYLLVVIIEGKSFPIMHSDNALDCHKVANKLIKLSGQEISLQKIFKDTGVSNYAQVCD